MVGTPKGNTTFSTLCAVSSCNFDLQGSREREKARTAHRILKKVLRHGQYFVDGHLVVDEVGQVVLLKSPSGLLLLENLSRRQPSPQNDRGTPMSDASEHGFCPCKVPVERDLAVDRKNALGTGCDCKDRRDFVFRHTRKYTVQRVIRILPRSRRLRVYSDSDRMGVL